VWWVFSDRYYKCSPDSDNEISLKIGQNIDEVKAYEVKACKKSVPVFGTTLYSLTKNNNNSNNSSNNNNN